MVAKFTKAAIWAIRFLQLAFAIVILGVASYLIHQFRSFGAHGPRETVVPLIFSILAILFTTTAIIGLYFINSTMQLASTIMDFILWVGYLASAGLLRHNFHVRGRNNRLWQKLHLGRLASGRRPHSFRNNNLVKLLSALVVIQLILFFISMLLQLWAAKKYRDDERRRETTTEKDFRGQLWIRR